MKDSVVPLLFDSSLAVWSSVRSCFQNGILFLNSDLSETVARCPGVQAIYDLGVACLLNLDGPPAGLRAAANVFPADGRLNVCFAVSTLLSDVSDRIVDILKDMPWPCVVTVLTTVSSSAHESSSSTTLGSDAYDYILSIWEESLACHDCPQHILRVQYFPMHVKVLGGVGFQVLLSEAASKAINRDMLASTTNDVTYVRQVLSAAEHGIGDDGDPHELEILAHAIAGLRANLSFRPSLFAAGPVARKVAQLMHSLQTWPQPLAGTSPHAAALVLVDRAADLSRAMGVPHTLAGLAGRVPGPVLSSRKAGGVAATWWQAAAGRDDGFAAAEMVLQRALADMGCDANRLAGDSDVNSGFRSGKLTDVSPLTAHAVRQCMVCQDAAQGNASVYDSLPHAALEGLPSEAASFTRAFLGLVQAGSDAAAAEAAHGGSLMLAATRALVIGMTALYRQGEGGGGASHMDPVEAFLSIYGTKIYIALGTAIDRNANAANCSAQEYISSLKHQLRRSGSGLHATGPHMHLSVSCGAPVAEVALAGNLSRLLYCNSMSIHSSDAQADLSWEEQSSPGERPVRMTSPGGRYAVGEGTEWDSGWEDSWEQPGGAAPARDNEMAGGWGKDGWGDGGEWMDAPSPIPANADLDSEHRDPAQPASPLPSPEVSSGVYAQPGDAITASVSSPAVAGAVPGQPKKVVKKKIVKKVVRKVVKRKVRASDQAAIATQGSHVAPAGVLAALTPTAAVPGSPVLAASPLGTHANESTVVTAEPAPTPVMPTAPPSSAMHPDSAITTVPRAETPTEPTVAGVQHGTPAVLPSDPGTDNVSQAHPWELGVATESRRVLASDDVVQAVSAAERSGESPDDVVSPEIEAHPTEADTAVAATAPLIPVVSGDGGTVRNSLGAATDFVQSSPHVTDEATETAVALTGMPAPAATDTLAWSDDGGWGDVPDGWGNVESAAADVGQHGNDADQAATLAEDEGGAHGAALDAELPSALPAGAVLDRPTGQLQAPVAGEPEVMHADVAALYSDPDSAWGEFPDAEVVKDEPLPPPAGAADVLAPAVVHGDSVTPPPQYARALEAESAPLSGFASADAGAGGGAEGIDADAGSWGAGSDGWGQHDDAWGARAVGRVQDQAAGDAPEFRREPEQAGPDQMVRQADSIHEQHAAGGNAEDVTEAGIGRGWADRAAAASNAPVWAGGWFVRGLESIASKVEAVVMAPAADDGSLLSPLQESRLLEQAGPGGSWGPEQWEGWGSHLSAPQRSLRLAREIGSTASLPVGPADALLQVAETGWMEGVKEEHEEGAVRAAGLPEEVPHVDAAADGSDESVLLDNEAGEDAQELHSDAAGWSGLAPDGQPGADDGGPEPPTDIIPQPVSAEVSPGLRQAPMLAVVVEDKEMGASGGLADGPAMAVSNATVIAEVSADAPRSAEHGWADSWSDAATLGTHADIAMLTEDASLMTTGADAASVSVEHGDVVGASAGNSPPGSGVGTDVGSAEAPAHDARGQGLSALAVHMHDAEASYAGVGGASVQGTSDDASRPDWSVVSTLGTDAVAAGQPAEEPPLGGASLASTGPGAAELTAAVRGTAARTVELKQVGKELGWSIASTGGSAGDRDTCAGAGAVPERTVSPRKRLQEGMAEDVEGAQELQDAADRVLEAGWGDGWSDAATLGTQAEFEAAVMGLGAGDAPAVGDTGADLQIVDEEGDASGWGGAWGAEGGTKGGDGWKDDQAEEEAADAAKDDDAQLVQGCDGWTGWGAWGQGSAGWGSDAPCVGQTQAEAEQHQPQEASPDAKAFAQALVRVAGRCARAAGPAGGTVDALVRAATGELLDSHVEGVAHVRGAVSSMLSHGLGALGLGGADPKLRDFSRIVVVVLGGVTMEEVAKVSQAVQVAQDRADHKVEVVLGGVHVSSAEDLAAWLIQSA
eukprot:jgi/Ulvmu1/4298/UM002_0018.1